MIVVFGSLNIDMVLPVSAMPRPGETVLCPEYKLFPGGKGANQAVAAAKAGSAVKMFGTIGGDDFGELACSVLKKSNVDITGVNLCNRRPTGCANICVDPQGENMITVASGANLSTRAQDIPDSLITPETTFLLQMETPAEENWALVSRAKKAGARVILNLAPAGAIPDDTLRSLSVLVVNQIEATILGLHLGFDVISPEVAARQVAVNYGITCIVTLGEKGAFACSPSGSWKVDALPVDPLDTTAAGDSFVGVLAASLDQGGSLEEALRRAAIASGLTCEKNGAQPSMPTVEEIDQAAKRLAPPRIAS